MDATAPWRRASGARSAVLALVLMGLLFTSVYPLRRYIAVRHEIASLRAEERALQQRGAELEREQALLQTDDEVEQIARERLGLVRPGEIPFVVPSPPPARAAPLPAPEPPRAELKPSFFERWWGAMRRAWRAVG